jgi:AraC-like DNA-binding protein
MTRGSGVTDERIIDFIREIYEERKEHPKLIEIATRFKFSNANAKRRITKIINNNLMSGLEDAFYMIKYDIKKYR